MSNNLIRFLVNSTEVDDMETKGDFALLLYLKGKRFKLISRVYFKCSTSCNFVDKTNANSCNSESFQFSIDKKATESWNDRKFLRCLIGAVPLHYAHLSGFGTVCSTSVKPNTNECSTINHILEKGQV